MSDVKVVGDRGAVILALGILALLGAVSGAGALLGIVVGAVGWVLANRDLAGMHLGRVDSRGRSIVVAGKSCAIVGVALGAFVVLTFGVPFLIFLFGPKP